MRYGLQRLFHLCIIRVTNREQSIQDNSYRFLIIPEYAVSGKTIEITGLLCLARRVEYVWNKLWEYCKH